jgi:hypothetical protein
MYSTGIDVWVVLARNEFGFGLTPPHSNADRHIPDSSHTLELRAFACYLSP